MNVPAAAGEAPARGPRRPARRLITIVLVLIGLGAAIWIAWALTHRAPAQAGGAGGPGGPGGGRGGRGGATTVGVASATTADIPITLEALGTVTPAATVTVRPQVAGTITQILFREGQMVRRGQALAVIDPRPLQMALMQAEGQLARDQAQLTSARLTLQRYRTLLAQDSIARQDVDTQAATVGQLEGTVTADRAAVGTARLNLGFSRVVAPVSGKVGLRATDVGNYIGVGDSSGLVVLTEVAPIDVEFTVPQDQVPQVQSRASRATLPVTALDRTRSVTLGQGTFSTLDNQVDTTTGTVRAKARFANADGALFPSQFVNVRLGLDTLVGAVVVPVTAVRTGANGDFVWLLNADHTVSMRKVKRGAATVDQVAITQGLKAGDKVITEGGDRLTDGGRVQLPGERPNRGQGGRPGGRRNRAGGGSGSGGGAAVSAQ